MNSKYEELYNQAIIKQDEKAIEKLIIVLLRYVTKEIEENLSENKAPDAINKMKEFIEFFIPALAQEKNKSHINFNYMNGCIYTKMERLIKRGKKLL